MVWKGCMVSLISNDCVGARFYQVNTMVFNNPFMWSSIYFDDYVTLLEKYNELNFNNVEFTFDSSCERSNGKSCLCKIDSAVDIHYIHFVEDKTLSPGIVEQPNSVDRICSDAIAYTREKYFERLSRGKDETIFLFTTYYCNFGHDVSKIADALRRLKSASTTSGVKLICLVDKSYGIDSSLYSSETMIIDTYSREDYTYNGKRNDVHFLKTITPTINKAIQDLCQK